MKPCPYCREEIHDDAVRCRWCTSDLTAPPEMVVHAPTASVREAVAEGRGEEEEGGSESAAPEPQAAASGPGPAEAGPVPAASEPPAPEPPQAPAEPAAPQAGPAPVERTKVIPIPSFQQPPAAQPQPAAQPPAPQPQPVAPQPMAQPQQAQPAAAQRGMPQILSPARTPSPSPSLTFSHEGPRFILGYSTEYFGLWDKAAPGPPVQKFPRTEQGWQMAWEAFMRAEMGG